MLNKCNSDCFIMACALLLILLPGVAHIVLAAFLENPLYILITAAFSLLNAFLLLKTALTDPGYVLKVQEQDASPSLQQGMVNGQSQSMNICETCKTIKPPRSHHCKRCGFCVERMDHHCPWVGNCVGQKNYLYFVLLLICATLESMYLAIVNLLSFLSSEQSWSMYLGIALMITAGAMFWVLSGLTLYHLYLISINQTTHEHARRLFSEGNPFKQSCSQNCKLFWCRQST